MRVIQRYLLFVAGLCVVLGGVFFGTPNSSPVSAERNQTGTWCSRYPSAQKAGEITTSSTPDDTTYFPFGFYCGTHPEKEFTGFRGFDEHRAAAERVSDDDERRKNVPAGTTLGFTLDAFQSATGFPVDRNGKPRDLMMWVVIDGNDDVIKSVDGGGGTADRCPGGAKYGTVYGYRHESGDGKNISPFAYAGGKKGKVSCGSEGRMIRWNLNSSSGVFSISTNVNFNIETFTDNNPGGQVCAREYISVNLPGDSQDFPPPNAGLESYIEQNVTASHIVKRSKAWCYFVEKSKTPETPPPSRAIPECTKVTVKQYRYGASGYSEPGDGVYGTDDSPYPVRYRVQMTGVNGGVFYAGSTAINATSGAWVYTGSAPTGSYNAPYTFNYTPGNNSPNGIKVDFVDEQYQFTGESERDSEGKLIGRQKNQWYPVGGGANIGAVFAGPCYAAACTIDQIEANAPGDKVKPNSDVMVRARIVNLSIGGTPLYTGLAGHPLGVENNGTYNNGGAFQSNSPATNPPANTVPLKTGEWSNQVSFTVKAPASGTLQVGAQPAYLDYFGLRPADVQPCTASKEVYRPPVGALNGIAACQTIYGWAFHPEAPSMSITIALSYINSSGVEVLYRSDYKANVPRPDVNAAFGIPGDHGFAIPIDPVFQNGIDQTFIVTAIDDFGVMNGSRLTVGMLGCGKYTLTPTPNGGKYLPTNEDPKTFQGGASISDEYPGWVNTSGPDGGVGVGPATAQYRYLRDDVTDAIGRYEIKPYTTLPGGRFVDRSYTSPGDIEPIAVAPGFQAGTEYCLFVRISHRSGYVDRLGNILSNDGAREESNCDKIVNEPTFVVNNGSVITGGDYQSGGAGSCTGGGTLGGWFNNTLPQYKWGSGSQLSALGLTKTTGFASARTKAERSPTDLSFANKPTAYVGSAADAESPSLGGNYGGSYCLPTIEAETAAEEVTGNLALGGETVATGQKKAYFRKGNVYIGGNITYNTTGWSYDKATGKLDKVPSMVVKTTGNIYISNNVTRLDGVYIAQRKDPTLPPSNANGGIIYTCGTASYQPVTSTAVYHNCRNQLTVYGTFIANKVNMMRTYGSLRDEKPIINDGIPPVAFEMTFTGNTAGKNCVKLYEPWAKFWTAPYDDNYLCVPTSANVALSWTYAKGNDSIPVAYGNANPAGATPSHCVRVHSANWTSPSDVNPPFTMAQTWSDNELCASIPISLSTNGASVGDSCTSIMEPGDPNVDSSGTRIWLGNVKLCNDGSSTKKVVTGKSTNLNRFACTGTFHKYSISASVAGCSNEGSLGGVLPAKTNGSDKAICTQESVGSPCISHGYGFSSPGADRRPIYRIHNTDSGEYLYTKNTGALLDQERAGYPVSQSPVFYLYTGADFGGVETIEVIPASVDPPKLPYKCSNAGTPSTATTCAAEVYYYTPELYLAEPKIKRTTNAAGDGPIEIDSMTSLPPVL